MSGDIATAEAQITDDIEWGLMPYNKVLRGKDQVIPWLKAASVDQKEPIVITNAATKDWGVWFCREFCATTEQPCARHESQLARE